tara:strand:+ start:818 stop:1201 length:384 start_codon:yes stop_codon:yes gene_type:complete
MSNPLINNPTWASLVNGMILVLQNPKASSESHEAITAELQRMAKLADAYGKGIEDDAVPSTDMALSMRQTDYPETDEDYADFLLDLRNSGVTNMNGAGPYLQAHFHITKVEANKVLINWMKSFENKS